MWESPDDVLARCEKEIERAHLNDDDTFDVVERLAAEHPELADELWAFLDDVYAKHPGPRHPDEDRVGRIAREMLYAMYDGGDDEPKTFYLLVRGSSGDGPVFVAESLGVPGGFLVEASNYGSVVPPRARAELARRAHVKHGIDEPEALASFDVLPRLRRFAISEERDKAEDVTYEAIVERSAMSDREKAFWLGLA